MTQNANHTDSIHQRRKLYVDHQVQGALIRQAVFHWAWTTLTFAIVIFFSRIGPAWLTGAEGPTSRVWYHLGPYVLASAALLPIIFFSTVRFSNRYVGPMVRVRRALKDLARGTEAEHLKFRDGDYWSDLADDINKISHFFAEADAKSPQASEQKESPLIRPLNENPYAATASPSVENLL